MIVLEKLVLLYYIYKQRSRYKKIQEERKMGRKMERKKLKKKGIGSACAILSATLFGFNAYCATNAYAGGSNPIAFTFYASVICIVLTILIACVCHIRIIPKKEECGWLILIGTLGGVTTLLLFTAFTYIASGIATILHFTYPVYVAIGSVWLLNKKMTKGKTIALVLSVLGVVFISDLSGDKAGTGILLALLSGLTYAGYVIFLEKTHFDRENCLFICFNMTLVRLVLTFVYGVLGRQIFVTQTAAAWGYTAIQASLSLLLATMLFQIGVKYIGGMVASVFSRFEPLTCLIVGVLFLGENINYVKIAGCVLICLGILVVIYDEFKEES